MCVRIHTSILITNIFYTIEYQYKIVTNYNLQELNCITCTNHHQLAKGGLIADTAIASKQPLV